VFARYKGYKFKDFKKAPDPHEARPVEPAQTGLRREIKSQEIKETYFAMAFHIPGVMDTDTYAIDMLASILADGVSSRLYRKLKIEEQLVHSISAYPMSLKEPGLFLINGRLDAANFERALTEILFEIKKLGQAGPDPDEMERSRTGLESGFVYSRETMEGIAMKLGYFETTAGDYLYEKKYLEGINAVTDDDVRRVVERYFAEKNMTVTILHPEEETVGMDAIETSVRGLAVELGLKAGDIIHPARVALTGKKVSPGIFEVIYLLGGKRAAERLSDAADRWADESPHSPTRIAAPAETPPARGG